jgi:hypothetical protein
MRTYELSVHATLSSDTAWRECSGYIPYLQTELFCNSKVNMMYPAERSAINFISPAFKASNTGAKASSFTNNDIPSNASHIQIVSLRKYVWISCKACFALSRFRSDHIGTSSPCPVGDIPGTDYRQYCPPVKIIITADDRQACCYSPAILSHHI